MAGGTKRSCCCKAICMLVTFLFVLGLGGVAIWYFFPDSQKEALQERLPDVFNTTGSEWFNTTKGDEDDAETEASSQPAKQEDETEADGAESNSITDYEFSQCSDDGDCCNGLDGLCDLRVNEIMYAGLHNAMASKDEGFMFNYNHNHKMEQALEAGYRAINLDLAFCDGEIRLIHGECLLGDRDPVEVFSAILSFVDENPNEVVLIALQIVDVSIAEIDALLDSVPGFLDRLHSHQAGEEWPTLRESIDAKKEIMMFHYNGESCNDVDCPLGFHDWFTFAAETEFSFPSIDSLLDTKAACKITRGSQGIDFFGINVFLQIPSSMAAKQFNELESLANRVKTCAEENDGLQANVVWVDFWSIGDLPEFVQTSNSAKIGSELGMRRRLKRAA